MLTLRRVFVPLLAAGMLLATATAGLAEDEQFKGWWYASYHTTQGDCPNYHFWVKVRYLSELRRKYDPKGEDPGVVLRYQAGERQPWQWIGADGGISLGYQATRYIARGLAWEQDCTWRVRLANSDPPAD